MNELFTYFITWTTYGTWLLGDRRGWRKANEGNQLPQPFLEKWCQNQMKEQPVRLNENQRNKVEKVCHQHAQIRGWLIHAISVRSNHVHIVVTANAPPQKVRDQLKAYATRVLREGTDPVTNSKIWTRGGDIEFIDDVKDNLERVILYINEAQDRKGRDQCASIRLFCFWPRIMSGMAPATVFQYSNPTTKTAAGAVPLTMTDDGIFETAAVFLSRHVGSGA